MHYFTCEALRIQESQGFTCEALRVRESQGLIQGFGARPRRYEVPFRKGPSSSQAERVFIERGYCSSRILHDESAAKAGFSLFGPPSRFGKGPGASRSGSNLGEDEESEPDPSSMSDFSLTVGLAELPASVVLGLRS